MKETEIRALELVRGIRDQIYEETKSLSPEELRAFIAREAHRSTPEPPEHSSKQPAA